MRLMTKVRRAVVIAPSVLFTAGVIAIACRDATAPERLEPGQPLYGGKEPPPKKEPPPQPANFRLTGGGRVDADIEFLPTHSPGETEKSTPESRNFATFGFQARPVGPNTTVGSGNITWVEHNPGEAFTFHGRVTFFEEAAGSTPSAPCGRFGGTSTGRLRLRSGATDENASFVVNHACDVNEPGVGHDHISITITSPALPNGTYTRHALLSGGNIQAHKL